MSIRDPAPPPAVGPIGYGVSATQNRLAFYGMGKTEKGGCDVKIATPFFRFG